MTPGWTPADLGLQDEVPEQFQDVDVGLEEIRIDVEDLRDELSFDPTDENDLAEQRESALEEAHKIVDDVRSSGRRTSAMDAVKLDVARATVVGAMRAEYLRRQYGGRSEPRPARGGKRHAK